MISRDFASEFEPEAEAAIEDKFRSRPSSILDMSLETLLHRVSRMTFYYYKVCE